MPFPFMPLGAIVAGLILSGALTLFVLSLKALDRAATQVGGAVVGGLVSGIRDWSDPPRIPIVSARGVDESGPRDSVLPVEVADAVPVEPVHRS